MKHLAAPWFGHVVPSSTQPGEVGFSISQAPLVTAPGTCLPPGWDMVGDILLGCLLEKCEAAKSPQDEVEQA